MQNKKSLIFVVIALVVVIGGASVLYNKFENTSGNNNNVAERNNTENKKEFVEAPDFIVLDGNEKEVHFDELKGKPMVINFWASWCDPCQSEMPDFQEAYEKYGNDITFMMINMTDGSRETIESASVCIEESGYTFPVYFDTTYSAASVYGISTLPATYFIDGDGNIIANGVGMLSADSIQKGIKLIKER